MQHLTADTLKGNWGTLLLPVNGDDSIDYDRLGGEIDYLIEAGVDGIYSNGTAGEFHNQTEAEFDRIQALLSGKCRSRGMRFQIGASHPSPVVCLERIRRTKGLQPDAYQVILPDWVSTTLPEQVAFLQQITEAAGEIPVVLYHPPHAKSRLRPEDFHLLKTAVPGLIGVKVASGDAGWFAEMRKYTRGLSVFVPGHLLATGVKEQVASGAYSNIACLDPIAAQRWWHLMQGDLEEALALEAGILRFFEACITPFKNAGYSNPALDKFLAAVGGWADIGTRLRWPYRSIPGKEVEEARKLYHSMLPGFSSVLKYSNDH